MFSFLSEVELLDRMVPLKNCQTVFQKTCTILHPTAIYEGSNVSYPHQHLTSLFFYSSHLSGCEVVSHCGFDFYFPNEC